MNDRIGIQGQLIKRNDYKQQIKLFLQLYYNLFMKRKFGFRKYDQTDATVKEETEKVIKIENQIVKSKIQGLKQENKEIKQMKKQAYNAIKQRNKTLKNESQVERKNEEKRLKKIQDQKIQLSKKTLKQTQNELQLKQKQQKTKNFFDDLKKKYDQLENIQKQRGIVFAGIQNKKQILVDCKEVLQLSKLKVKNDEIREKIKKENSKFKMVDNVLDLVDSLDEQDIQTAKMVGKFGFQALKMGVGALGVEVPDIDVDLQMLQDAADVVGNVADVAGDAGDVIDAAGIQVGDIVDQGKDAIVDYSKKKVKNYKSVNQEMVQPMKQKDLQKFLSFMKLRQNEQIKALQNLEKDLQEIQKIQLSKEKELMNFLKQNEQIAKGKYKIQMKLSKIKMNTKKQEIQMKLEILRIQVKIINNKIKQFQIIETEKINAIKSNITKGMNEMKQFHQEIEKQVQNQIATNFQEKNTVLQSVLKLRKQRRKIDYQENIKQIELQNAGILNELIEEINEWKKQNLQQKKPKQDKIAKLQKSQKEIHESQEKSAKNWDSKINNYLQFIFNEAKLEKQTAKAKYESEIINRKIKKIQMKGYQKYQKQLKAKEQKMLKDKAKSTGVGVAGGVGGMMGNLPATCCPVM